MAPPSAPDPSAHESSGVEPSGSETPLPEPSATEPQAPEPPYPTQSPASLVGGGTEPERTSYSRLGFTGVLVIAAGSLLAIPGVTVESVTAPLYFGPILAGPLLEEILKPAGLLILLGRDPQLRIAPIVGAVAGAFSGLVFAALENAVYFNIYNPDHSPEYAVWRWTVCVALHVLCSALVGYGLARARATPLEPGEEYRLVGAAAPHLLDEPRERSRIYQGISLRLLVLAVVIHGTYNLFALMFQEALPR